jgi:excisionase family DNA binding protein
MLFVMNHDAGTEWLTTQEAARRIGVSPITLKRWEAQGRITSHRTPTNHRRWDAAEIDALMKASA